MADRYFTQDEVNKIVAARLNREREHMTKEYENTLKRCMAAIHLTLYQETCALKRELDAETKDPLWSERMRSSTEQETGSVSSNPVSKSHKGGGHA